MRIARSSPRSSATMLAHRQLRIGTVSLALSRYTVLPTIPPPHVYQPCYSTLNPMALRRVTGPSKRLEDRKDCFVRPLQALLLSVLCPCSHKWLPLSSGHWLTPSVPSASSLSQAYNRHQDPPLNIDAALLRPTRLCLYLSAMYICHSKAPPAPAANGHK